MSSQAPELPTVNPWVLAGFRWIARRHLQRHFHCVAVNSEELKSVAASPADRFVIYANHASWWDPLLAIFLAQRIFPDLVLYAPIDAVALRKYRIFSKIGFFPVERGSLAGARAFLNASKKILSRPGASLWLTPEGRFTDVRDTESELASGLAHIISTWNHLSCSCSDSGDAPIRFWAIAAAVEYVFWEERKPEVLVRLSRPVMISDGVFRTKDAWSRLLKRQLLDVQRQLAESSIARDAAAFERLLGGSSGTSFAYDAWRRLAALWRGQRFEVEHGDKFRQ